MNAQISFFDTPLQTEHKVIPFPSVLEERPNNSIKGKQKTVYPIKSRDDQLAIAKWLMENKKPTFLVAFILGLNLGLRANELLALRYCDVLNLDGSFRYQIEDMTDTTDGITINQSKTSKRRTFYLNEACIKALDWYIPNRDERSYSKKFLFPSPQKGEHIKVDTMRKTLKSAARACGIQSNVATHSMRKTFGYSHFTQTHDLVYLQKLFGHSTALTTMRYIGVMEEDEKKAYHKVCIDLLGALNGEDHQGQGQGQNFL